MIDTLEQADIRDVWDEIRPGIEYTKRKTGALWRPEDIYAACISNRAFVYIGETGFIVVQPGQNMFNGKSEMFIWIAYAQGEKNIERFQSAVDDLADDHGFDKMTMWSCRPGFDRIPGWKAVATVYERELG
jgi:hypothetical protein